MYDAGMRRHIAYAIVALCTFFVGLSISDFGQCNRLFGPRCCGAVNNHAPMDTPLKVEIQMVEIPDPCLARKQRSANGIKPIAIVVITVKDGDGNTYRVECM